MENILLPYQHLKIELEEIKSATNNFHRSNCIGGGGYGPVYRGEVSHSEGRCMVAIKRLNPKGGQGAPEFLKEITMLFTYRHENLISLVGFCCEGAEMILVYKFASRGSLDSHLNSPHLSWSQRIKICLDAAKGISYAHDPREKHQRLIHCDIKCANILLDDQWNARVSDFGLSIMGSANEETSVVVTLASGTWGYIDPLYRTTNTLTKESDTYSFGVVLFEVLCGKLCCTYSDGRVEKYFVPTWIESYKKRKLNDIIFKHLDIQPLDQDALETFSDIAYRCLNKSRENRPKMAEVVTELQSALESQEFNEWILLFDREKMSKTTEPPLNCRYNGELRKFLSKGVMLNGKMTFLQQFQHLNIELKAITSATNNFDDEKHYIGGGGFGKLYEGELWLSKRRTMVTIRRLDRRNGEGTPEFLKEIGTLSCYSHENLISLLGFCCQGSEMIVVYEHVSRGSLDRYLNSPHLTWIKRLKICLNVTKGLSNLHDPRDTHQTLIHCDLKSSNILLDDKWNGKVSDIGLSIIGSANEQQSVIVALEAGTEGYIDPHYAVRHTLTKESDLYSLGVVLFEVLCGTLCCTYNNGIVQQVLVPMWIEKYKQKKLNDIIFKSQAIQPLDQCSLEKYSDIAYRCLKESREDRPKMSEVITELESALQVQAFSERCLLVDYKEMIKSAEPPLDYSSKIEFMKILFKGVLLHGGNRYFSLNKKGEHCEMIRFEECVDQDSSLSECYTEDRNYYSVFGKRDLMSRSGKFNTRVKTQFLSPRVTYTVNLVSKFETCYPIDEKQRCQYVGLRYKLDGETEERISHLAYKREDGWWECELCVFTSDHNIVDLRILFVPGVITCSHIALDCIDFRPMEKESRINWPDMSKAVTALDSEEYSEWELPSEYEEMIKTAEPPLSYRSNGELRTLLSKPILLNYKGAKVWFSLKKKGEHCAMIPIEECLDLGPSEHHESDSKISRFSQRQPCYIGGSDCCVKICVKPQLLSIGTTYKMYLVFKFMCPVTKLEAKCHDLILLKYKWGTELDYIQYIASERDDGWWMTELYQSTFEDTIDIKIQFDGLIGQDYTFIQAVGIEFLPITEEVEHEPQSNWEKVLPSNYEDSSSEADWEKVMPSNYEYIMSLTKDEVQWENKKHAYLLMRKGFLINDHKEWFYLRKNGQMCHMISAGALTNSYLQSIEEHSESRFKEVGIFGCVLNIEIKTQPLLLSYDRRYATYLVYKLKESVSYYDTHMIIREGYHNRLISNTLLLSPLEAYLRTNTRVHTKTKGLPQERDDGWLEIQISEFQTQKYKYSPPQLSPEIWLEISGYFGQDCDGILIEGIEFRPI